MTRQDCFNDIEKRICWLVTRIEHRGELNLLDLHIHAEDFYARLLNLIFGWNLTNRNTKVRNSEGIDLVDSGGLIVAQVSATGKRRKINSALTTNLAVYRGHAFKFVCITKVSRKLRSYAYNNPHGLVFAPATDIHDSRSVLTEIKALPIEKMEAVREFLRAELKFDPETSTIGTRPKSIAIALTLLLALAVIGLTWKRSVDKSMHRMQRPLKDLRCDLNFTVNAEHPELARSLSVVKDYVRQHANDQQRLQRHGIDPLGSGRDVVFAINLDRSFSPLDEPSIKALEMFRVDAAWYTRGQKIAAIQAGTAKAALQFSCFFFAGEKRRGPYLLLRGTDGEYSVEAGCEQPAINSVTGDLASIDDLPDSTLVLTMARDTPLTIAEGTLSVGDGQAFDIEHFESTERENTKFYWFKFPGDADFGHASRRLRLQTFHVTPEVLEEFERRARRSPIPLDDNS